MLVGLWSGRPFHFDGDVYHVQEVTFRPPPIQRPRIPIWVGGVWPHRAPFRRAARWDGVFPINAAGPMTGPPLEEIVGYVREHRRAVEPLDVVVHGTTGADPARDAEYVAELRTAGLTWWLEYLDSWRGSLAELLARVRSGPPPA